MADLEKNPVVPSLAMEEKVYRQLRNALIDGAFAPGDRLSIRRVAAALETSPMPARSALRRLATEQALDVLPSGTAVVPRLTRKAFTDMTLMRLELEPLAVKIAAPLIKKEHYKNLEAITVRHHAARERSDPEEAMRADREFLFAVYQFAKSPMLLGFIESIWLRRSPLFWEARWALLGRGGRTVNRHKEMLAALVVGDVEQACALLREEIDGAAEFLLENMQFADDPPDRKGLAGLSRLKRPTGKKEVAGLKSRGKGLISST